MDPWWRPDRSPFGFEEDSKSFSSDPRATTTLSRVRTRQVLSVWLQYTEDALGESFVPGSVKARIHSEEGSSRENKKDSFSMNLERLLKYRSREGTEHPHVSYPRPPRLRGRPRCVPRFPSETVLLEYFRSLLGLYFLTMTRIKMTILRFPSLSNSSNVLQCVGYSPPRPWT